MWRLGEDRRQPKGKHKRRPCGDGPSRSRGPGPHRSGGGGGGGPSSLLIALSVAVLACAHLVQGAARPGSSRDPPIVDIKGQGMISGREVLFSRTQKATLYLNIPFAQPPIGDLRFAPPKTDPLPRWENVRNGSSFGPACMQKIEDLKSQDKIFTAFYKEEIPISEDCLYLNVFVPDGTKPADGWPVMLWLHAGDFNTGAACLWDGSVLALRQKVVVVTTNYRLNIFGFFTTLDANAAGNWGLWDQKAAIKWVRDKIRFFGGNSDAITIFGHGAGAVSVGIHMISEESLGFQGAIAMSGSSASLDYYMTVVDQANKVQTISQTYQCNPSTNDTVPCLRNNSTADVLLRAGLSVGKWGPVIDFTNVMDISKQTVFLRDMPDELLKKKNSAVPFITGFANHEDAFKVQAEAASINYEDFKSLFSTEIQNEVLKPTQAYKNNNSDSDSSSGALQEQEEDYDEGIEPSEDPSNNTDTCVISKEPLVNASLFYYSPLPKTNDTETLKRIYAKFLTDKKYASNVYKQAYTNSATKNTYLYRFDYRIKSLNVGVNAPDWAGVPHMYELPFVWGSPYSALFKTDVLWNSADKKTADTVMSLFGSFARSVGTAATAGPQGPSKWEPFTQDNPTLLIIDKDLNQESVDFRAFAFWTEYYPEVRDHLMSCCATNGALHSSLSSTIPPHSRPCCTEKYAAESSSSSSTAASVDELPTVKEQNPYFKSVLSKVKRLLWQVERLVYILSKESEGIPLSITT